LRIPPTLGLLAYTHMIPGLYSSRTILVYHLGFVKVLKKHYSLTLGGSGINSSIT
jgi:hypothetical protein